MSLLEVQVKHFPIKGGQIHAVNAARAAWPIWSGSVPRPRRAIRTSSQGQRQRIGVVRAIAAGPKLLIADEPVSALDVSIQSQILNLLVELRDRLALSLLFISHDLAVIRYISERVAVMYLGQPVEVGDAATIYEEPAHPYTQALLSAIPQPDPERRRRRIVLPGDVPGPEHPPAGCPFHPRCPQAMERCQSEPPAERDLGTAAAPHLVRCHLY